MNCVEVVTPSSLWYGYLEVSRVIGSSGGGRRARREERGVAVMSLRHALLCYEVAIRATVSSRTKVRALQT